MTRRPAPRMVFARKSEQEDIRALKAAHRDPEDLTQRVAAFRVFLDLKRKGVLPMYEKVRKA